jgi:hypothetical protein
VNPDERNEKREIYNSRPEGHRPWPEGKRVLSPHDEMMIWFELELR